MALPLLQWVGGEKVTFKGYPTKWYTFSIYESAAELPTGVRPQARARIRSKRSRHM